MSTVTRLSDRAAATESVTARSESMETRSLTASGHAASPVDEFRRQQADRAIARIQECYRRGLAIPTVF